MVAFSHASFICYTQSRRFAVRTMHSNAWHLADKARTATYRSEDE